MRLAIMQPYLFPYIGYFQLIAAVDAFVIHDDVQFIKGGWINRNRILLNGKPAYITLPVAKGESGLDINQRYFRPGEKFTQDKAALLRQIEGAYRMAPHFPETIELVRECFKCSATNVAAFVANLVGIVCEHLDIRTPLTRSSALDKDERLAGQDRVIAINKLLGASEYMNPSGGSRLYDKKYFSENGLTLKFVRPQEIAYPQFDAPFVPSLSIVDILMFNSLEAARHLLTKFDVE